MSRDSIILYGHCQIEMLGAILNTIGSVAERFTIHPIMCYANPATGEESPLPPPEAMEHCKLFVVQSSEMGSVPGHLRALCEGGGTLRIPVLFCQPLWPQQVGDLCVPGEPQFPFGRFPYGDRVLLDLAASGQDSARIVERYLQMDFAQMYPLDDLLERWLYQLRQVDEASDFGVCDFIWRHWRRKRLFWTFNHPSSELLRLLLARVLDRLPGEPVSENEIFEAARRHEPDLMMAPIHPSVGRHFRIRWFSEYFNYRYSPYGYLTHREWALAYLGNLGRLERTKRSPVGVAQ